MDIYENHIADTHSTAIFLLLADCTHRDSELEGVNAHW